MSKETRAANGAPSSTARQLQAKLFSAAANASSSSLNDRSETPDALKISIPTQAASASHRPAPKAEPKIPKKEPKIDTRPLRERLIAEIGTEYQSVEQYRLEQDAKKEHHWKRWGPYLAERQWATVREDYSANGDAWTHFPHSHSRSRAYRWGEDGIGGISDNHGRLCFSLALWNTNDSILKERLFGVTGHEGNHGEDVKELYYYLDSTPTHSYMKFLYKYPQSYPYETLVQESVARSREVNEFEILDTDALDDDRYWDVFIEVSRV